MQLALNKGTNDLFKPDGGGVTRVSDGRFIVQQVQSRLRVFIGEWILDSSIGWLNAEDFDSNFSQFDIEDRARTIILTTQGVNNIVFIESTYSNRVLTLTFEAETIYGVVHTTIPWDNSDLVLLNN